MTLEVMLDKARAYESAQKYSEKVSSFHQKPSFTASVSNEDTEIPTTSAAVPGNNSSKINPVSFVEM